MHILVIIVANNHNYIIHIHVIIVKIQDSIYTYDNDQ